MVHRGTLKMSPNPQKKDLSVVPDSDFLQDVSIFLGKRLKSVRRNTKNISFECSKNNEDDLEKFSIEALLSYRNTMVKIVLWEDAKSWTFRRDSSNSDLETYSDVSDLTPYGVADLIRMTLLQPEKIDDFWGPYEVGPDGFK